MKELLKKANFSSIIFLITILYLTSFLTACVGTKHGSGNRPDVLSDNPTSTTTAKATTTANAATAATGTTAPWQGSNLFKPYPKHNCDQPLKPDRDDHASMYMLYNEQLEKYRLCIEDYAKNAQNDAGNIEQKANSALREYRNFVTRP